MFIVLQRFKLRLGTIESAGKFAAEDLLPRVNALPGFVSFHVVDAGDRTIATVGLFETQQGADEATRLASLWFRSDWPSFMAIPPEITRGAVLAGAMAEERAGATAVPVTFPQIERRRGIERRWGNERRARAVAEQVLSATGT